ncbi:MAG: hypothetical protein KFF73_09420 [Cyclobacteriaceae bacterium]|nr:hypothetical protein [Cyclobacteriaceae bacterium]
MSTYLLIWKLNPSYITEDPVKRGTQWKQLLGMVEQDIKKGITREWGAFIAESAGYSLVEGSELEIGVMAQRYAPYVEFKTHACASVEQTKELLDALTNH